MGGTASRIWIKTRKIVGSAVLLLDCAQVFYTSRGGGIGGPNPPYGALGSPVKTSRNLFKEIKLQSSCMFFTITFAWFVRAIVRKQF